MSSIFLGDWDDVSDLMRDFEITEEDLRNVEILFAAYTYEDYSGDAFVLFRKDDILYEVNGGHCSCYGLEGQWEAEETTKEALLHRANNATYGVLSELKEEFLETLRHV
jgi:hypothetical protein